MTRTTGKGFIPKKCPYCKEEVDWEYEDIEIEGRQAWQEIYCPNCESKFCENFELTGWETIKAGTDDEEQ